MLLCISMFMILSLLFMSIGDRSKIEKLVQMAWTFVNDG